MIWLDIREAPGYEISNEGLVRNSHTGRILKTYLDRPNGYEKVKINGQHRYIHKLVAERFYDCNDNNDYIIKHIDGNKRRNYVSNLEIIPKSAGKKHLIFAGKTDKNG